MDVREDAARRDGDAAEELVQLLVVAHGEGDVSVLDLAPLQLSRTDPIGQN